MNKKAKKAAATIATGYADVSTGVSCEISITARKI